MTGRILKLDAEEPQPEPKRSRVWTWILFGIGLAALFAVTVLILLRILPGPHTQSDYLIAGGFATMITLLVVFAVLLTTVLRTPFLKRRTK